MEKIRDKLSNKLVRFLTRETPPKGPLPFDFERLSYEIRSGDVLLISGRSRVSEVIKYFTQSHWSHAALYIGRLHDIESAEHRKIVEQNYQGSPTDQLILESLMGSGVVIHPLTRYSKFHTRICRPTGLLKRDAQQIINYGIERLGCEYDVRQIFDLARFLLPWSIMPRRWHSSLFVNKPGAHTHQTCSFLLAEAFKLVQFPILPVIKETTEQKTVFLQRNTRLCTPSDFDFSPYFDIIKYPMLPSDEEAAYHNLPWQEGTQDSFENTVMFEE